MRIAVTSAAGRGATDALLAEVARRLLGAGLRVAGAVQVDGAGPRGRREMRLRVLPEGPLLRISEDRGASAEGCRLDPGALEAAVGEAAAVFARGADVLVVNKFGRQEAEGRGFRDLIAEAAMAGVPVVVGLDAARRAAFDAFTGGAAEAVAPEAGAILDWVAGARLVAGGAGG